MAQLPPDGTWLVQQIDGQVVIFNRYTEEEIVRFNPASPNESAMAQKTIYDSDRLTPEEKCFAHFWSGYFHAHMVSTPGVVKGINYLIQSREAGPNA